MTPSTTLDKQRRRLTIEMHNPVRQIFEELNQPGITQASVAITYAFIIAQEPHSDWTKIITHCNGDRPYADVSAPDWYAEDNAFDIFETVRCRCHFLTLLCC